MRVLVACEFSGIVRDAFAERGHDAWSCDLLPTERPGNHIQGDVLEILDDGWDLMIAHPPCTHLCVSGERWFDKKRKEQDEAVRFFAMLLYALVDKICVENPVGIISTRIRKPDQIVNPFDFGDPYQKTTCLWLKNLSPLVATKMNAPLFGEQVDRGEFYVSPSGKKFPAWCNDPTGSDGKKIAYNSDEIKMLRSKTFPGIARAMAEQWG